MSEDVVACRCGWTGDRLHFAQCPECGDDLWDVVASVEPSPPEPTRLERPEPRATDQPSVICLVVAGHDRVDLPRGGRIGLGRDPSYPVAAAFARHDNVSRFHAVVRYDGQVLHVTDIGSANGTFVDGTKIEPNKEYELGRGQSLRLAADVPIDIEWRS